MALNDKKYEKFYNTTGSGKDKIESGELTKVEAIWDADRANGCDVYIGHDDFGPIIFQLQQMQDELDALRTEIALNKGKTTFPGIGTSGSTCLAGDTTTISTSQASAITANTSKVSFPFTGATPYAGGSVSTVAFTHNAKNNTLGVTVTIPQGPKGLSQPGIIKSTTLILK